MPKFEPSEGPDLVSTAEAAQMLGCHIRTIHRLVESGDLRVAVKFPGRTGGYLFRRTDVDALASDGQASA